MPSKIGFCVSSYIASLPPDSPHVALLGQCMPFGRDLWCVCVRGVCVSEWVSEWKDGRYRELVWILSS